MLGVFFLSCASIMTLYFITYYTPGNSGALGRHGRYFIPFAPLFFLAIAGLFKIPDTWKPFTRRVAIISFFAAIGFYSFGIYAAYYTDCGYRAYVGGKCVLPIYKNIEKEGVPEIKVNAETTIVQTFTSQCNELESVAVFVKSVSENRSNSIHFSLLDENGQMLAEENVPVSELTALDYLTLPITPATGTRGSNFELKLEASDPNPLTGVGIGFIQGGFHSGELIVAGVPTKHDLIFHYTCTHP